MGIQGMTHARMVRSNAKHAEMSRDFFSFAVDPWLRRLIRQKPRRSRVARNAGNKATTREHDFLSLYTTAAKDPSLQLHDAKPPPPSQGFFLRTHDFLQPLEKPTPAPAPPPTSQLQQQQQQQAFPGGIGTFSISHVAGARPVAAAVVKAEPTPFVLWGQPAAAAAAHPVAALGTHIHTLVYSEYLRRRARARARRRGS